MQANIQKQKRRLKKNIEKLINRLLFIFKAMLLVLFLFLLVFFSIAKSTWGSNDSNVGEPSTALSLEGSRENQFIERMEPYAKEAQTLYGVRPSVLIAQAALESSWGDSSLSQEANNYFGIKASTNGEEYSTKEFTNDTWIEIDASFRQYKTIEDSVMDYAKLLSYGTDWNAELYHGAIRAPTYEEAAIEIQQAGYATDPSYADKVIQIIEQYHLYELDTN